MSAAQRIMLFAKVAFPLCGSKAVVRDMAARKP